MMIDRSFNYLFLGLDDSITPYAHYFKSNNVSGQELLNLTTEDLSKLHVEKIGHQVNLHQNIYYLYFTESSVF